MFQEIIGSDLDLSPVRMKSNSLQWLIYMAIFGLASGTVELPIALICEFRWETCCMSLLAALQLGINDANTRNGSLIPNLASTSSDIRLKLQYVFDPDDTPAWESFKKMYESPNAPLAVFGGYYTSKVKKFAHQTRAWGLPQFAYCSGDVFRTTPVFDNVFRTLPVDTLKAIAAHKLMERLGIKAAVAFASNDAWSLGLQDALSTECLTSSYKCTVRRETVPHGMSQTLLADKLTEISAAGIRCMVNFLAYLSDGLRLGEQAYLMRLAGSLARGYVWMYALDFFTGQPTSKFGGGLYLHFANNYMKVNRITAFNDRWTEIIPNMLLKHVSGHELTMTSSRNASSCMFLSGPVYDSLARMRIALDRVNLSMPSNPGGGLFRQNWLGSSLMDEVQRGVDIDGIVEAPNLRKSPALGQQWEENLLELVVYNLLTSGEVIQILKVSYTALSDGPDLARGMLSGGVPFGTQTAVPATSGALPGHLRSTPCNGPNEGKCFTGTCVTTSRLGSAPGWCKCPSDYIGRYCDFRGLDILQAPQGIVPINMTISLKDFQGVSNDGDKFTITAMITMSWEDERIPYDTGNFIESESEKLLRVFWSPEIETSNTAIVLSKSFLTINRDPNESKNDHRPVFLSVVHEYVVTQSFEPSFSKFPFDTHSLELEFHARSPEVRISYIPGVLVTQAEQSYWASTGWVPDLGHEPWAVLSTKIPELSFELALHMQRTYGIHVWRLLVPSCILVVISWSGFWISPKYLMPRFASGFISFLTMQTFKRYASSLMPKGGKIPETSLIDIYISVCGILMALSVVETVCVQYMNENISHWACRNVDITARWAFPTFFTSSIVMMFLITDVESLLVVEHVSVVVFSVVFFGYAFLQGYAFPILMIVRGLRKRTPGRGSDFHREFEFEPVETKVIYDRLCHISRRVEGGRWANSNCLCDWLIKWSPSLKPHSEDLRELTRKYFGEHFYYPVFKAKLGSYLTDVERLLTGYQPYQGVKELGEVGAQGSRAVPTATSSGEWSSVASLERASVIGVEGSVSGAWRSSVETVAVNRQESGAAIAFDNESIPAASRPSLSFKQRSEGFQ